MTSLRHMALGCCLLTALAGMLRLFWPENSFKSVINTVLVLYIITVGVQLFRGFDWGSILQELQSLPAADATQSESFSAYQQELALTASLNAVREVLLNAGIDAAVSWQDGTCVITPTDIRDRPAIEALLSVNAGELPWRISEGAS